MDSKTRCCGRSWCVRDACGIVCAIFTWHVSSFPTNPFSRLLMFYGEFCIVTVMLTTLEEYRFHQVLNGLLFHVLAGLAFISHVKTMLTDPGAVPRGNATDEYIERLQLQQGHVLYKCAKCCSIKPERAHHCSICERCIRRMDHHCPWVNNCIGEANQKYFVLFTMYIALLSAHSLYWAIWQLLHCVGDDWRQCSTFSPPATTLLLVFLLFESILFMIFTAVMFGTQLSAICSDETGIESLKRENHRDGGHGSNAKSSSWKNLQVIFGGPFSSAWFNPFVAPYFSKTTFEFAV